MMMIEYAETALKAAALILLTWTIYTHPKLTHHDRSVAFAAASFLLVIS